MASLNLETCWGPSSRYHPPGGRVLTQDAGGDIDSP